MRVELTKEYAFEAAHRLPMVPPDHKCFRMHGHSYRIEVTLGGDVDERAGWLVDFGDITAVVEPLLKRELDHRALNDVPGLENPTSEVLCGWLWARLEPRLPGLRAITVMETCTARCTYRGE
ncbi:MAG: 6-carboxytetrahydropterin synthase QueD [Candidatus Eisenbacteria bacterium RBG_16_71_46]|nr:MAG: 6-carboxytetrahydropterin synthase QueD [Candidatus Eisenbacteria bacterium RBG_16_71_46]